MVVNPAYQTLDLSAAAIDSFPRAEPACHDTGEGDAARPSVRCSLDLLPYAADFDDAAVHIRAATTRRVRSGTLRSLPRTGSSAGGLVVRSSLQVESSYGG